MLDSTEFHTDTESSSPSPNVSANDGPPRNSLLSVHNQKKNDVNQSRSKDRAFKISRKSRQWIIISTIILSVLTLPILIILSMQYKERTSKLKDGKIHITTLDLRNIVH